MKNFIALTSEIYKDKLILLNTSIGKQLFDSNGISTSDAIDFLWSLHAIKKKDTIFICYAFSRDNEFIFSGLPKELKDKLFKNFRIRNELEMLENEKEELESSYYNSGRNVNRDVNGIAESLKCIKGKIQELSSIYYSYRKISLANGKILTLSQNKSSFSIYDIAGFFDKKPLYEMVKLYLNEDVPLLVRETFDSLPLMEVAHLEAIKAYSDLEVKYITRLMENVDNNLRDCGINLSRYHGVTAITIFLLSSSKAKKEYHNYKKKRTLSPELDYAVKSANYGGRVEQLKIGTFENVYYYDMNSAYAWAAMHLPKMLRKPVYKKEWSSDLFSLWHIEYDLPKDLYFGLLPNRDFTQSVKYKLRGKGYYWQPEVVYLLEHYPEYVQVNGGFVLENYEKAEFTKAIEDLYLLRRNLQVQNNPIQKILKLALASTYGKFCQHNGRATYYNLFYAGFITSFVRAQLLEAIRGKEFETIAFATDGIHTCARLDVNLSDDLSGFRILEAAKGKYLDNGIHRLYNESGEIIKEATQGFREFDFDKAFKEFEDQRTFNAVADFFVGHNLATLDEVTKWGHDFGRVYKKQYVYPEKYLKIHSQAKSIYPLHSKSRIFQTFDIDSTSVDSKVVDNYTGLNSAIYQHSNIRDADFAADSLFARRI